MVFSWVSRFALAFSALRARARALLLCFREILIVEELSVSDREISYRISIQCLIHAPSLITLLPLPRIAFLRLLYNSIAPTQDQQFNSLQQSLQRTAGKTFHNNLQCFRQTASPASCSIKKLLLQFLMKDGVVRCQV